MCAKRRRSDQSSSQHIPLLSPPRPTRLYNSRYTDSPTASITRADHIIPPHLACALAPRSRLTPHTILNGTHLTPLALSRPTRATHITLVSHLSPIPNVRSNRSTRDMITNVPLPHTPSPQPRSHTHHTHKRSSQRVPHPNRRIEMTTLALTSHRCDYAAAAANDRMQPQTSRGLPDRPRKLI